MVAYVAILDFTMFNSYFFIFHNVFLTLHYYKFTTTVRNATLLLYLKFNKDYYYFNSHCPILVSLYVSILLMVFSV